MHGTPGAAGDPWTRSLNLASGFEDKGVALAAAAAQRNHACPAAAPLQRECLMQDQTGPEAPTGWPMAMAPPSALILSASIPRSVAD
ncbi:hypothetical protein AHiyo4_48120 [Arthrobacter sp. Hiyo4]|nr:hypothetical protein AHiyo4_48120 [Arthrobacter sp. Hiyo4]